MSQNNEANESVIDCSVIKQPGHKVRETLLTLRRGSEVKMCRTWCDSTDAEFTVRWVGHEESHQCEHFGASSSSGSDPNPGPVFAVDVSIAHHNTTCTYQNT